MRASEFIFEDPASKAVLKGKPGSYYFLTPSGQKLTVGNGFPDTKSAMQWAEKNPQLLSKASASSAGVASKAWTGAKAVGKKAALPIAVATEIWDGYTQIKALPTNLDENQYRAEVTKIVSELVASAGLFWVGAIIGGALAGGPATGPVAIIGALAGGVVASWVLDDSVKEIVDAIVNAFYHTKNLPAKTAQPAQATKSAAPAQAGWKQIWDLNRETIKNPNLIYPGQQIKLPNGKSYTVVAGDTLNKIAAANPA